MKKFVIAAMALTLVLSGGAAFAKGKKAMHKKAMAKTWQCNVGGSMTMTATVEQCMKMGGMVTNYPAPEQMAPAKTMKKAKHMKKAKTMKKAKMAPKKTMAPETMAPAAKTAPAKTMAAPAKPMAPKPMTPKPMTPETKTP